MTDNIILAKAEIIKRCLQRINEEYGEDFDSNYTKQDAIILNIQRACEATIDMGSRMIRLKELSLPQSSREVFVILQQSGILSEDLSTSMQNMVGLRNIAIHAYQKLNLDIVKAVIERHLEDFNHFSSEMVKATSAS